MLTGKSAGIRKLEALWHRLQANTEIEFGGMDYEGAKWTVAGHDKSPHMAFQNMAIKPLGSKELGIFRSSK